MTLKEEIEAVFKKYLKATYTQDFEQMYASLYEDDVQNFRDKIVAFAYKMDEFGETQEFLTKLGFKSLQELEKLSLFDFMLSIFKLTTREIGQKYLNKILSETNITNIDETDFCSIVSYEYPINVFGEWDLHRGDVQMIKSRNKWKIFFKSGLETGFNRFQEEIDRYYERKSKDNLHNLKFEGDLTTFSIVGFKDFSSGKIVFEPRFKDAGDFSEGLAYVQIMRKYGYINLKGEIAIKPQFIAAKSFSQKMASVNVQTDSGEPLWGFINKKGLIVIPPQFTDTSSFSEGLCAVKLEDKWGYIDTKGELIIPCKFNTAEDFDGGTACVELYNSDGELTAFVLDKKGRIREID
jgi:hypothetical protein